MLTVVYAAQKGGVGKSTLAAGTAVAAWQDGLKVAVLDLDPQATTLKWGQRRGPRERFYVAGVGTDVKALNERLEALKQRNCDLVILDTQGVDGPAVNAAMRAADLVMIPTSVSGIDIIANGATFQALARMGLRDKLAFVLNKTPPIRRSRTIEAAEGIGKLGPVAEPHIVNRVAHSDAMTDGSTCGEGDYDPAAGAEIKQLWAWILSHVNSKKKA